MNKTEHISLLRGHLHAYMSIKSDIDLRIKYVELRIKELTSNHKILCSNCANYNNNTCSYLFENRDGICKAFIAPFPEKKNKEVKNVE